MARLAYNARMRMLFLFLLALPCFSQTLTETVRQVETGLRAVTDPAAIVECTDPPVENSLTEVNASVTTNQNGCEPLAPGKHRLMRRDGYKSGNYLLRNLGNNRLAAVLNLNFTPGLGASAALVESMKARTLNCVRSLAPYLRNGNERLDIQIIYPGDRLAPNIPRPAANTIEVTPQNSTYRGDAGHYGSNFTCMTIGHEILHLLGLCDEYHEGIKKSYVTESRNRVTTQYLDWSCRPVTVTNSYMRNIRYAYGTILPQVRRCDCGPECQAIMNGPEDIKRMYLSMDGDDYINTETSLSLPSIESIDPSMNEVKRQFCSSVQPSGSLPYGVRPPVMKSFVFEGESNNVFNFTSYRPRSSAGTDGTPNIWFGVERHVCNCNGDTHNYCRRMMAELQRKANEYHPRVNCPLYTTTPLDVQSSIGPQNEASGLDNSANPPQLVLRNPGTGESLLRPQHFERIRAGNCRGNAASNYERCEEFAYRGRNPAKRDFTMQLPMNMNENQCSNLPADCLNDRYFLDSAPSEVSGQ